MEQTQPPKKQYNLSQHYTFGKIAKEYKIQVATLWSWLFVNEEVHAEVEKFLSRFTNKSTVLLPPALSEKIFKTIDEEK